MSRLWVRVVKKHKIARDCAVPCLWGEQRAALEAALSDMDLPTPIWLGKHENEFEKFRRTAFSADHFMEDIDFDRLEIEFLDDTGKKRKSDDPRNAFP